MKKLLCYVLLVFHLIFVLYFWWSGSHSYLMLNQAGAVLAFGRLAGLLAVSSVLLQLLIMSRTPLIETAFGLNKLTAFHRLNGYFTLGSVLMHPIFITWAYSLRGKRDFLSQFINILTQYEDTFKAFLAVILFIVVVLFSVYIVRKRLKYEMWYGIHLLVYLAILLSFGHQLSLGGDFSKNILFTYYWVGIYGFVVLQVIIFRFMRIVYNYLRFGFYIEKVIQETEEVSSIYIRGRGLARLAFKPGQFVFLYVLTPKYWWQHHPFSVSMLPKDDLLRLTIKNSGDFTSEVRFLKSGTRVLLDGPYGSLVLDDKMQKILFIAGGIGITPLRSLLEAGVQKCDIQLLYSDEYLNKFVFKREIDALTEKYGIKTTYIVTQDESFRGEKGRIDREKLSRLVPDLRQREIYLCGPVVMIEAVTQILLEMGVSKECIHSEKFSLP